MMSSISHITGIWAVDCMDGILSSMNQTTVHRLHCTLYDVEKWHLKVKVSTEWTLNA